jgi:hypothetical protein
MSLRVATSCGDSREDVSPAVGKAPLAMQTYNYGTNAKKKNCNTRTTKHSLFVTAQRRLVDEFKAVFEHSA